MRSIAFYLLASLGGNAYPSTKETKKILYSMGIEADDNWLSKVVCELNGKNIQDFIQWGCGWIRRPGLCCSCHQLSPGEDEKEESEESDNDMGFGLFH